MAHRRWGDDGPADMPLVVDWFGVNLGARNLGACMTDRGAGPSRGARYSGVAMILHWIVAVLIAINVSLGLGADAVPDDDVRAVIDLHKSIGISVLGLVILRLLWRAAHAPPSLPATYPRGVRLAAFTTHWGLYLLMLAIPISGWMHDSAWKDASTHPMSLFWSVPWPRVGWIERVDPVRKEQFHVVFYAIHAYASYALYALLALHVAGALKHQFWDRERELQRMPPGR